MTLQSITSEINKETGKISKISFRINGKNVNQKIKNIMYCLEWKIENIMTRERIENIKTYIELLDNCKGEYVALNDYNGFINLSRSVIYGTAKVHTNAPFFNRQTIEKKVIFEEFLKNDKYREIVEKIKSINDTLISEISLFEKKVRCVAATGISLDSTLLKNFGDRLIEEMVAEKFDEASFKAKHIYIESRLDQNAKDQLISNYREFKVILKREFFRLEDTLNIEQVSYKFNNKECLTSKPIGQIFL